MENETVLNKNKMIRLKNETQNETIWKMKHKI